MKLSFSFKVPMKQRVKILFLGGLYFHVEYRGQHKITNMVCIPMRVKESSKVITKEK